MSLINIIDLPTLGDERGNLIALEGNQSIPFKIKRVYYIFGTKKLVSRGFHAHKELEQMAICVSGSCRFTLDDGKNKEHILLDGPTKGLIIKKMIWREMYDFSENCVLLVIASQHYDEKDYLRNYEVFKDMIDSENNPSK